MGFGQVTDFEVPLANREVAWIKEQVRSYRWFEEPEEAGWRYGANQAYMRCLQDYWLDSFSWRHAVTRMNALPHFRVELEDDFQLHCIHRRSPSPNAIPLLISHGWPGSILEFIHLIERLAEPENDDAPAFHVIAPSLPGYAWSDKPKQPIGPKAVAGMYDQLMSVLGYKDYVAQGGDWGCVISGWLGLEAQNCRAIHLSGYGLRGADMSPKNEDEQAWLKRAGAIRDAETGYLAIQSTKPQSLAYAMMDSPMGVAAWFVEKFCAWNDGNPQDPPFEMDWLLTNIMIYLTTRSFNTASWLYRGQVDQGGFTMPEGSFVEKPTGVANFPQDLLSFPPRSMAERHYNVIQWTDMPRGGHFASLEEPELFIDDLRDFGSALTQTDIY